MYIRDRDLVDKVPAYTSAPISERPSADSAFYRVSQILYEIYLAIGESEPLWSQSPS